MILSVGIFSKLIFCKANLQVLIYYNNNKYFLVLVIYISVLCLISFFLSFFSKCRKHRLKQATWPKFYNIIFLFMLKIGLVRPVDQQINLVLPKDLSVSNETTTSIIFIIFKDNANYLVRYAKNIRSHEYQLSKSILKYKKILDSKNNTAILYWWATFTVSKYNTLRIIVGGRAFCYFLHLIITCLSKKMTWKQPSVIKLKSIIVDWHMNFRDTWSMFTLHQPILAKKNYDISKFQLFKKITMFHNILNISRLYLDCIRHFRGTSHSHRLTWLCSILSGN